MTGAMRLRSTEVSYGVVRTWIDGVCRDLCGPRLSESGRAAVVLAVHETVRNVVEHASGGHGGFIELSAKVEGDVLSLRLVHDGDGFDRASAPAPVFDGTAEGGFGLFLAESAVDRIEYGRADDGRSCVWMVKILGAAEVVGSRSAAGAPAGDERKG